MDASLRVIFEVSELLISLELVIISFRVKMIWQTSVLCQLFEAGYEWRGIDRIKKYKYNTVRWVKERSAA